MVTKTYLPSSLSDSSDISDSFDRSDSSDSRDSSDFSDSSDSRDQKTSVTKNIFCQKKSQKIVFTNNLNCVETQLKL